MFERLNYGNEDGTIIQAWRDDGSCLILEPDGSDMWRIVSTGSLGKITAYVPPKKPTAKALLEAERASMSCETAQMALHLIDLESGATEAAILANPRAKAIWTKAVRIRRAGPILDALKTVHSETAIDAMFRAANLIEA